MSHSHLTLEERIRIEIFVSMGLSCREMARRLGRSHSTLSRELRRNVGSAKRGYCAQSAERRARKRRKRPRHYRCMNRPGLIAWVDEKLRANWSPEQIAGRIRLEYPEDQSMRISTETVYPWVYAAAQFDDTSYRHLRRAHKGQGRRLFPGRIDISCRPGIVELGTRFGDWEADLVCASKGKAAAARLYRTQEPLSPAGQGCRQDSRVLQCGAHFLLACCAVKAEADLDA